MEPGGIFMPKDMSAVSVKYGCESASTAEMRSAGSNFRSRSRRSIAAGIIRRSRKGNRKKGIPIGDALGNTWARATLGHRGNGLGTISGWEK